MDDLLARVDVLEREPRADTTERGTRADTQQQDGNNTNVNDLRGNDLWHRFSKANTHELPTPGSATNTKAPRQWPLKMPGPLGAVTYKDRSMFEDKLMLSDEYRYNGIKSGTACKTHLEKYIVARSTALRELLK